ncbi:MAG: CCA tRNA nucleotidyltransferase [Hyphomicrobiaceae bacterium]
MTAEEIRDEGRLRTADWLIRPATVAVLKALGRDGHRVRVVGGAVRNALIGEVVNDIDMATDARPEEVMALAQAAGLRAVPTGLAHGTVTVIADHQPYEVTTLRRDVETFGRHARVDFTRDWAEDAKRRDFTINALFCEADGTVIDTVGGLADLAARRIRFIGEAVDRIREDYLRILRFFRFSATYGNGEIDRQGLAAAVAERAGLRRLSGERVHSEVKRLIVARKALAILDVMLGHGLIVDIVGVPWLTRLGRVVAQEQSLGATPDPTLRLGALALAAPEDAQRLFQTLKLSGLERGRLQAMASTLGQPFPETSQACERLLYRMGVVAYRDRLMLAWARAASSASDAAWAEKAAQAGNQVPPAFPLRGRDLIGLGALPGPSLGALLKEIEAEWVAAGFKTDREALLARAAAKLAVQH